MKTWKTLNRADRLSLLDTEDESGGYEKVTDSRTDYYGQAYKTSRIERVDNRTELD